MCTLHVSHSPLTGFLPSWGAAPVMPRWPNRVSKQEDLYTREKRSCTQRIRSRSRAKRQVEPVPFRSVPRAKVWEADALQRDFPRRTPLEGTEFLAKPKDHLRWLSKDLAAVAPERWFARLVVPTKHEAKVWPMQEDDLAKRCLFNGYQGSVYDVESKGKDGRWRKAVMKLPPESKLGLKDAIAYNWPSPDKTMAADDQSPSVDLDFKKVSRCPCISLMSHCGTIRLRLLVVFGDAMQSQALAMRAMCGRQALLLPL
ncbi:unnamed protein product [Durusdinium trenchii]|uniref:Uncharacterized protein n=1 Tax=Durusdinium trenchii TaxID=1381693 RepID=A0ABP0SW64_9DINO